MQKLILVPYLLLLSLTALAQGLLTNTLNRNSTSLNGKWNYITDPYETGYYNFHAEVYDQINPGSPSAYYNNYHAKDKTELVEYDFDKSPLMTVPGDWNTQKENLFYYEGTVWFRRMFDYRLTGGNRLFIYFGAVNYKADVYLNGIKLGTHEGGFTPFNFEITSVVKPAGNYLVVKADNKRYKEAVPAMNTDWWNYGGITRDVLLVEEPATFIQDYSIGLQKGRNDRVAGYVKLNGTSAGTKVSIRIPELKVEQQVTASSDGYARFEMKAENIQYWSPSAPKRYPVYIQLPGQTLRDDIGFRTIEAIGADILLNGQPVFLKGICMHEEFRGKRACTESDALALLTWAKELGCNFIRLAHYPHNEYMVRLADKMGLLVWEEIPVYWTIQFGNESVYRNASNQLAEMITRDKNRASVIIWSMANETPLSENRNTFLKNLVSHARSLDSSRLISAALLTRSEKGMSIVDDKIGEYLDIVAFNQYRGWYGGDLSTAPEAKWVIPYNKPVVVSEFGGDARQGLHGDQSARWTEEYQEYLYRQNLKMIEKMPNIRGLSPWILTDFRSPRRVLPGIQDGFNRKGLISDKGIKKKAYYILQKFYNKNGIGIN